MFLEGLTTDGPDPDPDPAHRAPEPTLPGAQVAAVVVVVVVAAVVTPAEAAAVRTESGNRQETHPHPASKRRSHTVTKKVHLLQTVFWTL